MRAVVLPTYEVRELKKHYVVIIEVVAISISAKLAKPPKYAGTASAYIVANRGEISTRTPFTSKCDIYTHIISSGRRNEALSRNLGNSDASN